MFQEHFFMLHFYGATFGSKVTRVDFNYGSISRTNIQSQGQVGEFLRLMHIHSDKRKSLRPINHLPFLNMRTSPSLHSHALVKRHQSLSKYSSNSNFCQICSMVSRSDKSVETVHRSVPPYSELRNGR